MFFFHRQARTTVGMDSRFYREGGGRAGTLAFALTYHSDWWDAQVQNCCCADIPI